jgi:predicted lipoprotein with Yx(FWY)xxD motif
MPVVRAIASLAVIASLVVSGCTSSGAAPTQGGGSAGGAGGVTVGTASSANLGTFLTGPNGMTLYTHAGDGPSSSTCTGGCASAWPPLTTSGQPTAGVGVPGQLGTMTRADGATQVTYDGVPLYYWQGDAKPGDVTGDGLSGFSVAKVSGTAPVPSASRRPGY